MKELKDYLHLYLGCDVMCFWQSTNPAIKPEQKKLIAQKSETPFKISLPTALSVNVKPILRPLSDITEKEQDYALKLGNSYLDSWIGGANRTAFLLSKHFDLFGLIEAGLAIDKSTLKQSTTI